MVLGQILKVGSVLIKHRKAIYAVLTAQDRYISSAFRYGGYGKATSYGVRSGALAGSIAGAFITNAPDSPGNDAPISFKKNVPKTNKPYKTRGGQARSYSSSIGRRYKSSSRYGYTYAGRKCKCGNRMHN